MFEEVLEKVRLHPSPKPHPHAAGGLQSQHWRDFRGISLLSQQWGEFTTSLPHAGQTLLRPPSQTGDRQASSGEFRFPDRPPRSGGSLDVSKTVAWRILRLCHAQKAPGGALLFDRLELVARLEELAAEGGVIAREVARHARVEEHLLAMRSYLHARQTKVVRDELAPALMGTRFQNLPANITFTPQSLRMEFYGTEDFLAIVYALQKDYLAVKR